MQGYTPEEEQHCPLDELKNWVRGERGETGTRDPAKMTSSARQRDVRRRAFCRDEDRDVALCAYSCIFRSSKYKPQSACIHDVRHLINDVRSRGHARARRLHAAERAVPGGDESAGARSRSRRRDPRSGHGHGFLGAGAAAARSCDRGIDESGARGGDCEELRRRGRRRRRARSSSRPMRRTSCSIRPRSKACAATGSRRRRWRSGVSRSARNSAACARATGRPWSRRASCSRMLRPWRRPSSDSRSAASRRRCGCDGRRPSSRPAQECACEPGSGAARCRRRVPMTQASDARR